jgi:Ala-tRNA(Pro) deacylase
MERPSDIHPVFDKICTFLGEKGVEFKYFFHKPVKTSEEAAAIRPDFSLQQGAKAMIIKTGGNFIMCILPGNTRLENKSVRQSLGIKEFRFATPQELSEITGGVQIGGVPPFGNLFNIPIFADPAILENETIIFNAGDRRVSVYLKSKEWQAAVEPKIAKIAVLPQ